MLKAFFDSRGSNWMPYCPVFLLVCLQLTIAYIPSFHFLLLNLFPDDAFYYFNIARNINLGLDSTFDGVNLTNGYHPLWMLLILPIFKLFSLGNVTTNNFDVAPIYAALSLSIIFSFLATIVFKRILDKFTDNNITKSLVLFVTFFNPYVFYATLNGLETSLLLFVTSIFIYTLLSQNEPDLQGRKTSFLFGIVSGLLILSRLDMIFVVAAGYLFLIYKRQKFNLFMVAALTTSIIFFTWQIYNYLKFKMLLTTASVTITYVNHFLTYSDNGSSPWFVFLKTVIYMFDRAVLQVIETSGAYLLVLPIVGVAAYMFFKEEKKTIGPIWFLGLGLLLQFFVSASVRWAYRDWYFIPHLFIFSFIFAFVLVKLEKEFVSNKKFNLFVIIVFVSFASFFYIAWEKNLKNREIMQDTIFKATVWENENLPDGSKIGIFNSGIAGYFSRHKVYNLDGQVNSAASKNILSHSMWKYIKDENLDYIADFPQYFTYRFKNFLGISEDEFYKQVELVQTVESNGNKINIYKIKK